MKILVKESIRTISIHQIKKKRTIFSMNIHEVSEFRVYLAITFILSLKS